MFQSVRICCANPAATASPSPTPSTRSGDVTYQWSIGKGLVQRQDERLFGRSRTGCNPEEGRHHRSDELSGKRKLHVRPIHAPGNPITVSLGRPNRNSDGDSWLAGQVIRSDDTIVAAKSRRIVRLRNRCDRTGPGPVVWTGSATSMQRGITDQEGMPKWNFLFDGSTTNRIRSRNPPYPRKFSLCQSSQTKSVASISRESPCSACSMIGNLSRLPYFRPSMVSSLRCGTSGEVADNPSFLFNSELSRQPRESQDPAGQTPRWKHRLSG